MSKNRLSSQKSSTRKVSANREEVSAALKALEKIADEIQGRLGAVKESDLKMGQLLLSARSRFENQSDWIAWLQNDLDMSIVEAQRLMCAAKRAD